MRFPNAAKGISKIFTAEILQLITVLTGGAIAVLGVLYSDSMIINGFTSDVLAITILSLAAFTAVFGIIAFILKIIGFIQTSRDESFFRGVIWLTIISIAVSVVAGIFSNDWFWNNLANTVNGLFEFITSILVVLGISRMAFTLNDQKVIATSGTLLKTIIGIGVLSLVAKLFSIFLPLYLGEVIIIGLACLAVVLEIVRYILYLVLLSRAKNMLNE